MTFLSLIWYHNRIFWQIIGKKPIRQHYCKLWKSSKNWTFVIEILKMWWSKWRRKIFFTSANEWSFTSESICYLNRLHWLIQKNLYILFTFMYFGVLCVVNDNTQFFLNVWFCWYEGQIWYAVDMKLCKYFFICLHIIYYSIWDFIIIYKHIRIYIVTFFCNFEIIHEDSSPPHESTFLRRDLTYYHINAVLILKLGEPFRDF